MKTFAILVITNFVQKEYNKIYELLKGQIIEGHYAAGQKLPPERLLCEQMSVSRITARHALRLLEEDGLVERLQGKGTFINSLKPGKLPITDLGFARSVKDNAPGMSRKLIKTELTEAPKEISARLNLDKKTCFLAIRADILDGQVIGFDKAYIAPQYYDEQMKELLENIDFFERWVELEKLNLAYYRQEIEAIEADEETASLLDVSYKNVTLKSVETCYDADNKAVAVFESYYNAGRIKLTSTIKYQK